MNTFQGEPYQWVLLECLARSPCLLLYVWAVDFEFLVDLDYVELELDSLSLLVIWDHGSIYRTIIL